jgi:hypothetical protein
MAAREGWIGSESTQVTAALRRWSLGDDPRIIAVGLCGLSLNPPLRRSWLRASRASGPDGSVSEAETPDTAAFKLPRKDQAFRQRQASPCSGRIAFRRFEPIRGAKQLPLTTGPAREVNRCGQRNRKINLARDSATRAARTTIANSAPDPSGPASVAA